MLGMLEWLNHRNASVDLRPLLFDARRAARRSCPRSRAARWPGSRLVLLGGALLGWSLAVVSVRAIDQASYPLPKPARPFTHVVIDRTVCDAPLSTSGFIGGEADRLRHLRAMDPAAGLLHVPPAGK